MDDWRKQILTDRLKADLDIEKAVLEALKDEDKKSFVMKALTRISETKIKKIEELLDKASLL